MLFGLIIEDKKDADHLITYYKIKTCITKKQKRN